MKNYNNFIITLGISCLMIFSLSCQRKITVPEKVLFQIRDVNKSFIPGSWYRIGSSEKVIINQATIIEFLPSTGRITFGATEAYDSISTEICGERCRISSMLIVLDDLESHPCSQGQRLNGSAKKLVNSDLLKYRDGLTIGAPWLTVTTNSRLYNNCFLVDQNGFSDVHFLFDTGRGLSMRVKKKKRNSDSQVNVVLVEDGMMGEHCIDWYSNTPPAPVGN